MQPRLKLGKKKWEIQKRKSEKSREKEETQETLRIKFTVVKVEEHFSLVYLIHFCAYSYVCVHVCMHGQAPD